MWACGKTYEGSFKDGKPDGPGEMTYPQVHTSNWTETIAYENYFICRVGNMSGNLNKESFMALGSFPGVKIIIMKVMHMLYR